MLTILWLLDPDIAHGDPAHAWGIRTTAAAVWEAAPEGVTVIPWDAGFPQDAPPADLLVFDSILTMPPPVLEAALKCGRPFITIDHGWGKVSGSRWLLSPGERFLKADTPWATAMRRLWASPNRWHSFFLNRHQHGVHVGLLDQVGIRLPRATVLGHVLSPADLPDPAVPQVPWRHRDPRWLLVDSPGWRWARDWVEALLRPWRRCAASEVPLLAALHVGVASVLSEPLPAPRTHWVALAHGAQAFTGRLSDPLALQRRSQGARNRLFAERPGQFWSTLLVGSAPRFPT